MTAIELVQGDITTLPVDAIVNAANSSLMGGGGVDGAIHRIGGPDILEACKVIVKQSGPLAPGNAVITTGGKLQAKFVIHTVGPVWRGGTNQEDLVLANAYKNSLSLAVDHQVESLAFPNISTGVYGFPKPKAAQIAVTTVKAFIAAYERKLRVVFCCYDHENFDLYLNLLK